METWWILLIAAVIALVFVLAWSARKRRSYVDPTQVTIDAALAGQVTELYQQGKKVEAVKLLREQTGLSLADAVTIVEKIASRSKTGPNTGSTTAVRKERASRSDTAPSTAPVDLDTELEVRSLVADGDKATAISLVRARTGWNRSAATEYVDSL
ncbi:MAG TPA: hypothetical protein VIJ00_09725 [Nakamurella sp.]